MIAIDCTGRVKRLFGIYSQTTVVFVCTLIILQNSGVSQRVESSSLPRNIFSIAYPIGNNNAFASSNDMNLNGNSGYSASLHSSGGSNKVNNSKRSSMSVWDVLHRSRGSTNAAGFYPPSSPITGLESTNGGGQSNIRQLKLQADNHGSRQRRVGNFEEAGEAQAAASSQQQSKDTASLKEETRRSASAPVESELPNLSYNPIMVRGYEVGVKIKFPRSKVEALRDLADSITNAELQSQTDEQVQKICYS